MPGKLNLKIIKGNLQVGDNFILKMSPYVKAILGNQIHQTSPARYQHKNPSWSEEFNFDITGNEEIKFEVWNRGHSLTDTLLGRGSFSLNTVRLMEHGYNDWISVREEWRTIGQILVEMHYVSDAEAEYMETESSQDFVFEDQFSFVPKRVKKEGDDKPLYRGRMNLYYQVEYENKFHPNFQT